MTEKNVEQMVEYVENFFARNLSNASVQDVAELEIEDESLIFLREIKEQLNKLRYAGRYDYQSRIIGNWNLKKGEHYILKIELDAAF